MRAKLLSLIGLSILTVIILLSVVSATITFSNIPADLSRTEGVGSFNITISTDQTVENVTFSVSENITEGNKEITFTTPVYITLNDIIPQVITVNYDVESGFNFKLNKQYSTIFKADGNVSSLISQKISFDVNNDVCEVTDKYGHLSVRIEDISVEKGSNLKAFGEDNEWFPLDEIKVEIEVENKGPEDINDIEVKWGLYNPNTGEWYEKDNEKDFDLRDGKDKTIIITFKLDDDIEDFEKDYVFYAWATGEDEDDNDDKTCSSDLENVDIVIEEDFVVLYDIVMPELVSCGDEVQITADVWNIGDDDQDDVYVYVYNKDFEIAEEVMIGDIDAFEKESFTFDFIMPKDLDEKTYGIKLSVYDDRDDIYESTNGPDDVESTFDVLIKVENCVKEAKATVSASLLSGGQAGKELVVKATITNTGDSLATYLLNAANYTTWASLAQFDQSTIVLSAGSSQDVLITFNVNRDVIGDQLFNLEVRSGNEVVLTQPVSIPITKAGFSITGAAIAGDNWYLWGMGALNIILVIIIIIVAVRVARK